MIELLLPLTAALIRSGLPFRQAFHNRSNDGFSVINCVLDGVCIVGNDVGLRVVGMDWSSCLNLQIFEGCVHTF